MTSQREELGAEFESWLEQDVPGQIEHMIELAQLAERHCSVARGHILVRSNTCAWPIKQPVIEVTPAQLRAVADGHEQMAETLVGDAAELRDYADALEQPTALGAAILEHFEAMREEAAHREAVREEEYRIANDVDGVLRWEAIDSGTRRKLKWAGYLRVDDVRDALESGELRNAHGIGAASLMKIAVALAKTGGA